MSSNIELCDFSSAEALDNWNIVNDSVMGGLSESALVSDSDGGVLFSGSVSLENNGGFASMRYADKLKGLVGYSGFRINVQGDGKTYQLRAHEESAERGKAFKHNFVTTAGEWLEIDLPFADFILSAHGRPMPEAGKIDSEQIHQISFLIAGCQPGDFALRIRRIEAYR